jgi:hypothetical protein
MRTLIPVSFIIAAALCLVACAGDGRSQQKRVGGCSSDTVSLDIEVEISCPDPVSPVRVSILSVEDAGMETYRQAAEDLVGIIGGSGAGICSLPRLVIITEGPCWPRYRVDIILEKGSEEKLPAIRSALSGTALAGFRPSEERPEDYGKFFVQAAYGSTDRWTLWYPGPSR